MTATDAVLAEAKRYLGVREVPVNSNRGTEIDYWIAECGLDPKLGLPWCAAFVGQVGRQALGVRWPAPRTASVAALAAWGASKGLVGERPAGGDVFLLWNDDLRRFAHTGFVVRPVGPDGRYGTIEGNTNPAGGRDGYGVFARDRIVAPRDRFVRWETLVDA